MTKSTTNKKKKKRKKRETMVSWKSLSYNGSYFPPQTYAYRTTCLTRLLTAIAYQRPSWKSGEYFRNLSLPLTAHMPKDTKKCWFYALKSSGIFLYNPISTTSQFRSLSLYQYYYKFISYFLSCQFQFHYAYRGWVPASGTTDKYLRLLRILHFYFSTCY